MKAEDEWEWLKIIAGTIAVLGFIALIVVAAWNEVKHPCIKWETYACQETYCAVFVPHIINNGKTSVSSITCGAYATRPTTCSRCTERRLDSDSK